MQKSIGNAKEIKTGAKAGTKTRAKGAAQQLQRGQEAHERQDRAGRGNTDSSWGNHTSGPYIYIYIYVYVIGLNI